MCGLHLLYSDRHICSRAHVHSVECIPVLLVMLFILVSFYEAYILNSLAYVVYMWYLMGIFVGSTYVPKYMYLDV